jgi:site-specific DNA recombinase
MRTAIYARYSSENQRPESIDDQVSSCKRLAAARGFTVDDSLIFSDEATSGARADRKGLAGLIAASEAKRFEVVLVDDLSRLARDNYLMLSIMAELHFNGVRVVSVADGLDTGDEEAKLGIQIRGIFNELQLSDLKKKTLRGQIGQKERGFIAGEATFGYRSTPVGTVRMDKKGRPRPEGYKMAIEPREAAVILRIFQEFSDGQSESSIVKRLNMEGIPGRWRSKGGWSPATVHRILRNEKYAGKWVWNRSETRRDPKTGRRRKFPKPESEWFVNHDETLRIVPRELWDRVQARLLEVRKTWPGGKGRRGFEGQQSSRVALYPTELLSGGMVCGACGSAIAKVSGKSGGYYGCLGAAKGACDNRLLVRRTLAERIITAAVRERLSSTENLAYVLKRVEESVIRMCSDVPETIKLKEAEFQAEERRVANFIEFIAEGRGSKAVAGALEISEKKAQELMSELTMLRQSRDRVFKAPPLPWIEERVATLQEVLERRTEQSALLMRKLLGKIKLEPVKPDVGRPYMRARSQLQALALYEIEPGAAEGERGRMTSDAGSNSLHWWRRGESNPRPKTLYSGLLRAFPVVWISSSRTPAGRVPLRPSRFGFRPSSPREGDEGLSR